MNIPTKNQKIFQDIGDVGQKRQRLRGIAPDTSEIDVTPWVQWFVQAFTQACIASQAVVRQAVDKALEKHATVHLDHKYWRRRAEKK